VSSRHVRWHTRINVMSRYLILAALHAVNRVLSQKIVMEYCSATSSSDYEEDIENVCAILAADTVTVRRKVWVHDINMKLKEKGEFHHLVKELEEHPNRYETYFRMSKVEFNFVYDLIKGDIKTRNTQFREAISTEEKLAVCLR